ncbi:MAG: M56 family metallopeptidase [Sediminibacterium sp.]
MQVEHLVRSLVYALADSCWLAALLWLCYHLINWLMVLQPIHAYRLAGILVSFLLIGWITLWIMYVLGGVPVHVKIVNNYLSSVKIEISSLWIYVIACIYLVGLCFEMIRFFRGRWQLQFMAEDHEPLPEHWQSVLDQHLRWKNTTHSIRVALSKKVSSPLTFGWIKPLILFPLESVNYLDINEFKSILLHELAHVRRNDFFFQIIFDWMEILLFFNPFARDLFQTIRIEREKICDDEVVQTGISPLYYVSALHRCASNGFALSGTLGAVSKEMELLERVRRITQIGDKKKKTAPSLFWSALAAILVGIQFPALLVPNPSKAGLGMAVVEQLNPVIRTTANSPLNSLPSPKKKKNTDKTITNGQVIAGKKIKQTEQEFPGADLTDPTLLHAVGWQEKDKAITLFRALDQIRRPTQTEAGKMLLEAMSHLGPEEKIAWLQLMKKRLLQPLYEATASEQFSSVVPEYVLSLQKEELRLEAKVMLLIWMKWKEKNPGLTENIMDQHGLDSSLAPLISQQ